MSHRVPDADPARVARWCAEHLGSPPVAELFTSGYPSAVIGLRLADDREVVVKVRPGSPRIAACVEVQRRMFESGYPCPEPLSGPASFGGGVATAEVYVPGGAVLPGAEHASRVSAEAFARLIRLAPRSADVLAWTRRRCGRRGTTVSPGCGHALMSLTSTSTRSPAGVDRPGWVPCPGPAASRRARGGDRSLRLAGQQRALGR